jgi:eukaryotic-like serine/threonine-protein kinase
VSAGDSAQDYLPAYAPGQVLLEKYRIDRVLGEGGMGVVVAATHLTLGTPVAIKFLRDDFSGRGDLAARFLREAKAAVAIQSEHVARVLDVGTLASGAPYMVLELLDGVDLGVELARLGRIPVDDAVEYVLQACEAIAEAHGKGLVHRDIKPSNLFLSRRADGSPLVKVLDFGIAKAMETSESAPNLTATGSTIGSPMYMAPEQIRSARTVDARADVWSLGIVLHELIAGRTPFAGETSGAVFAAIAADAPTPLRQHLATAPKDLERVILRCLEKSPDARTPSVAALADDLAAFAPPRSRVSIDRVKATLTLLAAPKPGKASADGAIAAATASSDAPTMIATAHDATPGDGNAGPRRMPLVALVSALLGVLVAGSALALYASRSAESPVPKAASSGLGEGQAISSSPLTKSAEDGETPPALSGVPSAAPAPAATEQASASPIRTPPTSSARVSSSSGGGRKGIAPTPPRTGTGNGLIDSRR